MDKNLNEELVRGRQVIKKAIDKNIVEIELDERGLDELDDNDFDKMMGVDDYEEEYIPEKSTDPLKNVIQKAVSVATQKGFLPIGWHKDEDYRDAVVDIVLNHYDETDAEEVKTYIGILYGRL